MISVCIATYNGAKYLKEQLDSILHQLDNEDEVIISDEQSTDSTLEILSNYNDSRIKIFSNTRTKGVIGNFANAIYHAQGEYIFLADQDDVWLPSKINITVSKIRSIEHNHPDIPILVFTDATVVDEDLSVITKSIFKHEGQKPEFSATPNILCVANRIMGCTMAFNKKTKEICLPISSNAVMHDWWIALCVAKYGIVESIDEPLLLYRQHSNNIVGCQVIQKDKLMDKVKKMKSLWLFNKRVYRMSSSLFPMSFLKFSMLKIRLHI